MLLHCHDIITKILIVSWKLKHFLQKSGSSVNGVRRVINSIFIYFTVNSSCTHNEVFSSNQLCEYRVCIQHFRMCACQHVNKCFGHSFLCVCTCAWGSTVLYCKYSSNFLVCKHGLKCEKVLRPADGMWLICRWKTWVFGDRCKWCSEILMTRRIMYCNVTEITLMWLIGWWFLVIDH
jgi:hypothetical protein